ncbi:MAG: ankyrin repeat domain-containing protein [Gammaproteobacteria bacterium]
MLKELRDALKPDVNRVDLAKMQQIIPKAGVLYVKFTACTRHGDRYITDDARRYGNAILELRNKLNDFYAKPLSYSVDQLYELLCTVYSSYENNEQRNIVFDSFKKIKSIINAETFENLCAKYLFTKINWYADNHQFLRFLIENSKTAIINSSVNVNKKDENGLTVLAHALKFENAIIPLPIAILIHPACVYVDLDNIGLENLSIKKRKDRHILNQIHKGDIFDLNISEVQECLVYIYEIRSMDLVIDLLNKFYVTCQQKNNLKFYYDLCCSIMEKYILPKEIKYRQPFARKVLDRLPEKEINEIRYLHNNILCRAVLGCDPEFIRYLVVTKKVATDFVVLDRDNKGFTPLLLATESVAYSAKESFLTLTELACSSIENADEKAEHSSYDFKVNHCEPNKGENAVHLVAKFDDLKSIEALLKIPGCDANIQNKAGETALMISARAGHLGQVRTLLKFPGININLKNLEHKTAVDLAKSPIIETEILSSRVLIGLINNQVPDTSFPEILKLFGCYETAIKGLNALKESYSFYGRYKPENFRRAEFFLKTCFNPEDAFNTGFVLEYKPFYQATAGFFANLREGDEKSETESRIHHFKTNYLLAYQQFLERPASPNTRTR